MSMLLKCLGNSSLIVPTENVGIKDNLFNEEVLIQILDRQQRKLHFVEEATWKAEEDMKKRDIHLFESGENADQGTNSLLKYLIDYE